ncbi:MAG: very short patch repair endonuclease [Candidatus Binatota bacterium]
MSRIRAKDTKPELMVRRMVHGMGFRYRLHSKKLPGCPDLVFHRKRKVLFVHGCFWHRHKNCGNDRPPKSRLGFWLPKLDENRKRDVKNKTRLRRLGWSSCPYLFLRPAAVRPGEGHVAHSAPIPLP